MTSKSLRENSSNFSDACCRNTAAPLPRGRLKFRRHRSTTPSSRCCAIPTLRACRIPGHRCPCLRFAIRKMPANSSCARGVIMNEFSDVRRTDCGHRRVLFPSRLSHRGRTRVQVVRHGRRCARTYPGRWIWAGRRRRAGQRGQALLPAACAGGRPRNGWIFPRSLSVGPGRFRL